MYLAFLTLFTGLAISAVAIYYSVIGLAAIFSAATLAIVVMGTILEVSKLVSAWWLKANWHRAPILLRSYMMAAVVVLMLITSMGIFGFLSKAHTDQSLVSGDVQSKIAIYDEKIKTSRDNIEANRKALAQLDAAVDQTMARSSDEKGAERAVNIRRQQQRERTRLLNEIAAEQKKISQINEEAAPIRAEVRKVEAEVGPIKYIAKLIYGDNTDTNLLEKAVTWVIITIVFVFDPLAVLLLLAAQMSFQWAREEKNKIQLVLEQKVDDLPEPQETGFVYSPWPFPEQKNDQNIIDEANAKIAEYQSELDVDLILDTIDNKETKIVSETNTEPDDDEIIAKADVSEKQAMHLWKAENPNGSLKIQKKLLSLGKIEELPWMKHLKPKDDFVDEAAVEAAKWAQEQLEKNEESKKKESVTWMEKQGTTQVKRSSDE